MNKRKVKTEDFDELLKSINKVVSWDQTLKYQTRIANSSHVQNMGNLKERDILQILWWRPVVAVFFFVFLFLQTVAVWVAVFLSHLIELDNVELSIIVTGVLGESFGIVFLIVNFIFSKIDFHPVHNNKD